MGVTGVATFSAGTAALPAITTTGDTNTGIFFPAADVVATSTGGTERARIDASGNLGLGVTPSAWSSAFKVLQLGGGGALISAAAQTELLSNAYYDTSWKYFGTGLATRYQGISGQHIWSTAPSGTSGNAITFTQAMTLDSSGQLGIGTTSPGFALDVATTSARIRVAPSTTTNLALFQATNSGGSAYIGLDSNAGGLTSQYALNVYHNGAYPITFSTNSTERFRFGPSGQFGIGGATYGTSGQVLTSGGSAAAPTWTTPASGGFSAMTVITTSSNFTIPTGKTTLKVTVVGAGGGGGFGTAAAGGNGGNTTLASGTQSISTITGGFGSGGPTGSYYGGIGGVGSGGDLNFYGSDGDGSNNNTTSFSGNGGNSFLGGGGSSRGLVSSGNAEPGRIYGGGGGATYGGNGGGGGGTAIKYLTGMTPGNTLAITIGAGGAIGAGGSGNGGLGADGVVIIEY